MYVELLVHGAFNKWWDLPQKLVRPQSQDRVSLRFSLTQFWGDLSVCWSYIYSEMFRCLKARIISDRLFCLSWVESKLP